jgi:hypothetical protein
MRWRLPVRRCRFVPFQDQAAVERVGADNRRTPLVGVEHPAVVEGKDAAARQDDLLERRCVMRASEAGHQIALFVRLLKDFVGPRA